MKIRPLMLITILSALPFPAMAVEPEKRLAERTPAPILPVEHSQERAGNADFQRRLTQPSVEPRSFGGYIGGTRLLNFRSSATAGSSETAGVFGTDYGGLFGFAGRVFLKPSADPGRGASISRNYNTAIPHVPDPIARRPLRNAVIEQKNEREPGTRARD